MPLSFPSSPTNGQTYTSGSRTWTWNGTTWEVNSTPTGVASVTSSEIASGAVTQAKLASTISAVTICTSSTKPASPFDGQVIYMTDADQTAVWDGSSWVGIERSRDRNVIINGAMQVAQRGTSTGGITGVGYFTADRWQIVNFTLGTWTNSIENDAPTGSGFRKSLKMLCTTADASPAAGDLIVVAQLFEGQNMQQFAKGTASAKQFTLSFWVKSNVTGTFTAELTDDDNSRSVSTSYTISASATWEKKTITFPADTVGVLDNDNGRSFAVNFWFGAGTTFTSGTLNTTWGSITNANRAVGQVNAASATNNYWQITGVQLEAGAVATPFEFEDYGTTLNKCKRYYFQVATNASPTDQTLGAGYYSSTTRVNVAFQLPVTMRAVPTLIAGSTTNGYYCSGATLDYFNSLTAGGGPHTNVVAAYNNTEASGTAGYTGEVNLSAADRIAWSAEL
jgi:hypothetical protein